jgi:hypothetical protein
MEPREGDRIYNEAFTALITSADGLPSFRRAAAERTKTDHAAQ